MKVFHSALRKSFCFNRRCLSFQSAKAHVKYFEELVGSENVHSSEPDIAKYRKDWTGTFIGGEVVCLPNQVEQISKLLSYCNEHTIGVVCQGGNTGLVGGAVGCNNQNELILSMARCNKILDIDINAGILTCEAGCILESLDQEVQKYGFMMPLDLGAKGSCMIGGNVATNAGGLRVIKYGSMHSNVLGLEVVQADGRVLDLLRVLQKDNTGYALKHLFIGSEGTLGIITKVSIRLAIKPKSSHVILAKLAHFEHIIRTLQLTRQILLDSLSAFEFMDWSSVQALQRCAPHLLDRLQGDMLPNNTNDNNKQGIAGEVLVLIECTADEDHQKLDALSTALLDQELIVNAMVSESVTQERTLWAIRETVPVALMQCSRQITPLPNKQEKEEIDEVVQVGKLFKYDLSLPLHQTASFVYTLRQQLAADGFQIRHYLHDENSIENSHNDSTDEDKLICSTIASQITLELCNFGHAGDQNLHLNILLSMPCTATTTSSGSAIDQEKHYHLLQHPHLSKASEEYEMQTVLQQVQQHLDHRVYHAIIPLRGSISAEHGIGQLKKKGLYLSRSKEELQAMQQIKQVFDPKGILNPGKIFFLTK